MAHILVVDDVYLVRLAIGKILKRAGHSIAEAGNGDEALARIRVRTPDAVITDLWMPGSDGLGLIAALQAKFPAVGLVVMSGGSPRCGQDASLGQARDTGVREVLMKPIDKDELIAAIDLVLGARQGTAHGGAAQVGSAQAATEHGGTDHAGTDHAG